ncbi:MAG: hypothetical protein C5B51_14110 [Terriglobia bacterium]|nr:MAG: hypothetical protein C5B51_14110 [Terriglobia bacterium]
MWRWAALIVAGSSLFAQTAGMVRSAAVTFRAQRDSARLSQAQRREAERLELEAQQETRAGRWGEALRRYAHAIAAVRGAPWTPAVEFAASLDARVDHVLLAPGGPVTLSLASLFPVAYNNDLIASVFLAPAGENGAPEQALAQGARLESLTVALTTRLTIPQTLPGNYLLVVRLALPDNSNVPDAMRDTFEKRLPVHIESLSAEVEGLRVRLSQALPQDTAALAAAQYTLQFVQRVDRGEEGLRRYAAYPFHQELARANAILDDLEAGRDPLAGHRGDLHRAYRSSVDGTLQPYRLFIPDSYDKARPASLLVALHGAGGDENDFFDGYAQAPLKPEAQRVGFVVVCPKGREPNSGYRGAAERDVFDVMAEVQRDYRIDPARIFLMGHSMGAFAAWRLAIAHPDIFAALGPISGGGDPAGMVKIRHIPQYVVHGGKDDTVPVTQSRAMVEAGRKAGATIVYIEAPDAGHYEAALGQFGPMLDFFARQVKASR